jgi:hypothetical protein
MGQYMKRKIKANGSVPATKHMFMHEDKNTSVADYWERAHNIRLWHPEAPWCKSPRQPVSLWPAVLTCLTLLVRFLGYP